MITVKVGGIFVAQIIILPYAFFKVMVFHLSQPPDCPVRMMTPDIHFCFYP